MFSSFLFHFDTAPRQETFDSIWKCICLSPLGMRASWHRWVEARDVSTEKYKVKPLRSHGLQPTSLLGPWDSLGKNTGVGCHALLQGIFPTQGSNPCLLCLLHWQVGSLPLHHLGSSAQWVEGTDASSEKK